MQQQPQQQRKKGENTKIYFFFLMSLHVEKFQTISHGHAMCASKSGEVFDGSDVIKNDKSSHESNVFLFLFCIDDFKFFSDRFRSKRLWR